MDGTRRFQSTHPRGVRLIASCERSVHLDVSIHAPARGATLMPRWLSQQVPSFNPRTREGCDLPLRPCSPHMIVFQSTHPRGVRHEPAPSGSAAHGVSIHAPARGATGPAGRDGRGGGRFQSTHPRGVRRRRQNGVRAVRHVSIHAPARGATQRTFWPPQPCCSFNPRTREGCDAAGLVAQAIRLVSIHAPARGATGSHE